ncbi:MAG: hypothetical protein N2V76_01385, partial [Methanophagales archaeon]|nr:hypothetical protein [Methanophagales archaeon]
MQEQGESVEELEKLELSTYFNTDILITVPTKNVAETVTNVVETVDRGLTQHFPDKKSLTPQFSPFLQFTDHIGDIYGKEHGYQ